MAVREILLLGHPRLYEACEPVEPGELDRLAPSERYYTGSAQQAKPLLDWVRQLIYQLRHWLPARPLIVVGDNTYAALDLLHACQSLPNPVT